METLPEYFRLGYYKCKHRSEGKKISVINMFISTVNIYWYVCIRVFSFHCLDSMNNGASERLEFSTRSYKERGRDAYALLLSVLAFKIENKSLSDALRFICMRKCSEARLMEIFKHLNGCLVLEKRNAPFVHFWVMHTIIKEIKTFDISEIWRERIWKIINCWIGTNAGYFWLLLNCGFIDWNGSEFFALSTNELLLYWSVEWYK